MFPKHTHEVEKIAVVKLLCPRQDNSPLKKIYSLRKIIMSVLATAFYPLIYIDVKNESGEILLVDSFGVENLLENS
jgi:hypothetical protein